MMDAVLRKVRPEQFRELILFALVAGMIIFFSTQIDQYLAPRVVNRITTGLAITAVVAVGQVLVVLTRNIDLSVGSSVDRKSTRLNSSHVSESRMPSSA